MIPYFKKIPAPIAIVIGLLSLSFIASSCGLNPPPRYVAGKNASAPDDPNTVKPNGDSDAASIALLTKKLRGLSSKEVQNTVTDLFSVSIAPLMADHPLEATDTGFFNSINSFNMSSPLATWNSKVAALVASNTSFAAPVFKGLTVCANLDNTCLETNINKIAYRIYRRPPSKQETAALLASLTKFAPKTYDEAIRFAIEVMLQSSQFSFHVEAAESSGVLNGSYAVASRLAATLWQSSPDDQLLDAAAKGGLLSADSVRPEIARMLADPRAERGLGGFANEWLRLYTLSRRNLDEANATGLTPAILSGMILETEKTFAAAAMNPKADFMANLFQPKSTYLTADLAKFYGLTAAGSSSTQAVAVEIPSDSPRRGVLTQASFMFATTKRSATSVITRGNSIYETIICLNAGAPAPSDLEEAEMDAAVIRSKRDESAHRISKAKCGGCHTNIDPIGIAFENFDFLGRTRAVDEAKDPVKTNTSFRLDGKTSEFQGPLEVSAAFAKSPQVARCVAKQVLSYVHAGNLLDKKDERLDAITHAFTSSGYSFAELLNAVLLTPEFLTP